MSKTFFISTPIYYPSGKPHIGHAYTTMLADTIAKYKKLIGYDVFFLTGTDEHGKKIEDAAIKNNTTPIAYVDNIVEIFKDLWVKLGIDYTGFIRTTDPKHVSAVQKIFSQYYQKDLIYLDNWKGKYCISCEENILPKEIQIINGVECCPIGHKITNTQEESYFFKMNKFEGWIIDEFKNRKVWITPASRINELRNNFLETKLTDLSISRTSFKWGIPIIENPNHVMYVWMDALFSYVTALNYLQPDDSLYQKFWNHKDAEIVHLMSKEITRFHCVYWPIFLHSLGLNIPTKIISHGWIVTKEGKMSKSLGNVIDPYQMISTYGRDCFRYYLIKEMSLSNDNTFAEETMIGIYNGDLANNVGNLLSRTLGMLTKYTNNVCPKFNDAICNADDNQIINLIKKTNSEIIKEINEINISKVLVAVQNLINDTNKYIENQKPWELAKNNDQRLHVLLNLLVNVNKNVLFWLQPILIDGCNEASKQLNVDFSKLSLEALNDCSTVDNLKVGKSKPLYIRL